MIFVRQDRLCGRSVLHLEGSLRVPLNEELRNSVGGLIGRGSRRIVLNLAWVSDLDAGGVGELVRVYNMTLAAHGILQISEPNARVREVLDRAGLMDLLSVDDSGRWWREAV